MSNVAEMLKNMSTVDLVLFAGREDDIWELPGDLRERQREGDRNRGRECAGRNQIGRSCTLGGW